MLLSAELLPEDPALPGLPLPAAQAPLRVPHLPDFPMWRGGGGAGFNLWPSLPTRIPRALIPSHKPMMLKGVSPAGTGTWLSAPHLPMDVGQPSPVPPQRLLSPLLTILDQPFPSGPFSQVLEPKPGTDLDPSFLYPPTSDPLQTLPAPSLLLTTSSCQPASPPLSAAPHRPHPPDAWCTHQAGLQSPPLHVQHTVGAHSLFANWGCTFGFV